MHHNPVHAVCLLLSTTLQALSTNNQTGAPFLRLSCNHMLPAGTSYLNPILQPPSDGWAHELITCGKQLEHAQGLHTCIQLLSTDSCACTALSAVCLSCMCTTAMHDTQGLDFISHPKQTLIWSLLANCKDSRGLFCCSQLRAEQKSQLLLQSKSCATAAFQLNNSARDPCVMVIGTFRWMHIKKIESGLLTSSAIAGQSTATAYK